MYRPILELLVNTFNEYIKEEKHMGKTTQEGERPFLRVFFWTSTDTPKLPALF